MLASFCLFSGLSKDSTVPAGSLANASSVGAKTVNGPAPCSVSTSPAAFTAATSVVNVPAEDATPTMSCVALVAEEPACAVEEKAMTSEAMAIFVKDDGFMDGTLTVEIWFGDRIT